MSFSFDPALGTYKDHARLALFDVNPASVLFQDETIWAKINTFGYLEGLSQIASAMRTQIAMSPDSYDEGSGGLKMEWRARDQALKALIDDLKSGRVAPPDDEGSRPGASVGTAVLPDGCWDGYRPC